MSQDHAGHDRDRMSPEFIAGSNGMFLPISLEDATT